MFTQFLTFASGAHADTTTPDSWAPFAPLAVAVTLPVLVAGTDGRIYAIGGTQRTQPVATVQVYTPATDRWQVVAPLPSPRTVFAATADANGLIYVFGGVSCFVQGCRTTEIDAYDPAKNIWNVVGHLPEFALGQAAVSAADGAIYYIGQFGADSTSTLAVYDPESNTWSRAAPAPPLHHDVGAALGPDGLLYVVDGVGMANGSTISIYNPNTDHWRVAGEAPSASSGFVVTFGPDGRLYVIGGSSFHEVISPIPDVTAYDPTFGTWEYLAPLPILMPFVSGVAGHDGRIYIVGSYNPTVYTVAYANEVYTPACQYVLGFQTLFSLIPSIVGACLDNEAHNPDNGDALQHTTDGLLVWRKADNWTAFTDGYHTWVNGPYGVQERLNSERFPWENNPDNLPISS